MSWPGRHRRYSSGGDIATYDMTVRCDRRLQGKRRLPRARFLPSCPSVCCPDYFRSTVQICPPASFKDCPKDFWREFFTSRGQHRYNGKFSRCPYFLLKLGENLESRSCRARTIPPTAASGWYGLLVLRCRVCHFGPHRRTFGNSVVTLSNFLR